ncbi:MAG TPA: response regulator, partial [Deinococcales bacterium]|nr:response regulator [Deinococcales bacterium]
IFEPFVQAHRTVQDQRAGVGLGLAISRELARAMHGDVTVESRPGEGSTFTITLPRSPAATPARPADARQNPAPANAARPTGTPLVLVVEDDDIAATVIERHLQGAGYRTTRAANGAEGLQRAREAKPDAITLDLRMPVMDGWELLHALGHDDATRCIPVIVLSMAEEASSAAALGAAGVLAKPVRREQLLGALEGLEIVPAEGSSRVLVVDDDPAAVELVAAHLTGHGHAVTKAYGGQQALDSAAAEPPDLMILDLMMPEVTGFHVLDNLRRDPATQDMPVLVMTAKILSAEERRLLEREAVAVLEKGRGRGSLLEEVDRAIRARQAAGARPRQPGGQQG